MSFVSADSCVKALESMNGGEVDTRVVKVERAKRNTGYEKTPGQCTYKYCMLLYSYCIYSTLRHSVNIISFISVADLT